MSDKKDLTIVEKNEFQLPEEKIELNCEDLEGIELSFPIVKIPSGAGVAFEIAGENPAEPDIEKELVGIIIDNYPINLYYQDKYDGTINPPTCSSFDAKYGEGEPGGSCRQCPLNQYGSGDGGVGKACKNLRRLYILRSGEMLPYKLTLPPTSLGAYSNYIARLLTKGLKPAEVVTKITLKKEQNKTGISYSQAQFSISEKLSKEAKQFITEYAKQMKSETRKQRVENGDDYVVVSDNEVFKND